MSFALLHKWVAYLLSGLGLFALSLGQELSAPVVLVCLLAFVGSYFVEGAILHKPLYSRLWTGVVVVFLVVQVVRAALSEPSLALALEFAAVLQLSRLYSRRTAQDYQQIAVLAFLHLIAATVLSTELTYALVFVGFVIATPWMLALSHLRREIEANYPAYSDDGGRSHAALARVLASRRVVGGRFLLATALLALPLFAMTLAIFLMVPRVGQGFLNFGRGPGDKVAGFGDQVELGGFGVIRDDPTVVLRVTPSPALDPKGRRLSLRFRGTSFDHYDGRLWTRTLDTSRELSQAANQQIVLRRPPRSSDQTLRVVLDHLEQPVVFIPAGTVALAVDAKLSRAQRLPRRLRYSSGYDIRYVDLDQEGLMYDAYVSLDPIEHSLLPLLEEDLGAYLQVPPGHARIADLAQRVVQDAEGTVAKARLLRAYLQSERFSYSLEQPEVQDDETPLAAFLFRARRGHCEYFSTSLAIMLRTLGIPARNVTGLVGGQYNPYGGYYALRQGDAHSWVEVYVEGEGWLTFDPTPVASAALAQQESLWSDMHALVDALRVRWMTSVVGYDLRTQLGLLRRLRGLFATRSTPGADSGNDAANTERWTTSWARVAGIVGVLLLLAAGLYYVWWRRRQPKRASRSLSPQAAEAVKLYEELDLVLRRRGLGRAPAVTPLEHAEALRSQGFPASDVVEEVTQSYVDARYGEVQLGRERLAELRRAVATLEASGVNNRS